MDLRHFDTIETATKARRQKFSNYTNSTSSSSHFIFVNCSMSRSTFLYMRYDARQHFTSSAMIVAEFERKSEIRSRALLFISLPQKLRLNLFVIFPLSRHRVGLRKLKLEETPKKIKRTQTWARVSTPPEKCGEFLIFIKSNQPDFVLSRARTDVKIFRPFSIVFFSYFFAFRMTTTTTK